MSYDIELKGPVCSTCGKSEPEPDDCPNPTYNLTEIFDFALTGESLPNSNLTEIEVVLFKKKTDRPRGLRLLSGRKAKETLADICLALVRMNASENMAKFIKLEPENGWGDMAGAVWVMEKLKQLVQEYPEHTWEIR